MGSRKQMFEYRNIKYREKRVIYKLEDTKDRKPSEAGEVA